MNEPEDGFPAPPPPATWAAFLTTDREPWLTTQGGTMNAPPTEWTESNRQIVEEGGSNRIRPELAAARFTDDDLAFFDQIAENAVRKAGGDTSNPDVHKAIRLVVDLQLMGHLDVRRVLPDYDPVEMVRAARGDAVLARTIELQVGAQLLLLQRPDLVLGRRARANLERMNEKRRESAREGRAYSDDELIAAVLAYHAQHPKRSRTAACKAVAKDMTEAGRRIGARTVWRATKAVSW